VRTLSRLLRKLIFLTSVIYRRGHSEAAADRVEQAIYDAWTLTRYPNFTIVYRSHQRALQVVSVLHVKRNTRRILKNGCDGHAQFFPAFALLGTFA
jgi:hypothetical protein